jgi:hypothetical protein
VTVSPGIRVLLTIADLDRLNPLPCIDACPVCGSPWGRAKTKARHAWLFLKALIDAILFPEEVKIAYTEVKVVFGWVKQSWGSLKFLICHPKILVAKAKA